MRSARLTAIGRSAATMVVVAATAYAPQGEPAQRTASVTAWNPCFGLGFEGCCDGASQWCDNGERSRRIADSQTAVDGTPKSAIFAIIQPDPSGTYPIECPGASCARTGG